VCRENWSRFSGLKHASCHSAMTEVCSERNILGSISALWEGIQGNELPHCEKRRNHNCFNQNSRSEPWNHCLTPACKHRVGCNNVTGLWLVTDSNSFELQLGILIQQRKWLGWSEDAKLFLAVGSLMWYPSSG
jgi:hypothetical protein